MRTAQRPQVHGAVAPGFEAVRRTFEQNFARHDEIGAAISVYRHGRPVAELWAGISDPRTGRQWRADTLQVIYSATKSATATCVHLLAQRGQLDLDAPIAKYWPEFAATGKSTIPVRWVLSHHAGLPAPHRPFSLAEVIAWDPVVTELADQGPHWTPGEVNGYHAYTYGWLLGEVVRRVSGRSIGGYFADEIAGPLELDFWIGVPRSELSRVSWTTEPPELRGPIAMRDIQPSLRAVMAPYTDPGSLTMRALFPTDEHVDLNRADLLTAQIPAVNGACTATALARFYAALIGEVDGTRILKPETLATATTEQANGLDAVLCMPTRPALGYALPHPGLPWWSPTAFGHAGHGGALGYADPDSGIAVGYVTNRLHSGLKPDHRAANLARVVQAAAGQGVR